MTAALLEVIAGDADRALPRCRRGLEIAERIGSAASIVWSLSFLAMALAQSGSHEAIEVAERCLGLARDRRISLQGEAQHLAVLAEACVVAGDLARARRIADEAVEVARARGSRRYELNAWLAVARAQRATGGREATARAHDALAQLDAAADAIRAPNWRHVAELERADLAAAEGDAAARERHLRAALAGFEAIDAEYRVRQLRALLSAPA
jgi:ATP/maltotriose-dependent transcriptional regulator MalT